MRAGAENSAQLIVNKLVTRFLDLPQALATTYLVEVLRWNPQLGLVSKRDPALACERLFCESLEMLRLVREDAPIGPISVADVGSGGGFPGLVWAISEPEWSILLIERRARKASFLEATARVLQLRHVAVFAGQAAEATHLPQLVGTFDRVAAMAVGSPDALASSIIPLLAPTGRLLTTLPRGRDAPEVLGTRLRLTRTVRGDYGIYSEYVLTD